jgi:hypothetical protein
MKRLCEHCIEAIRSRGERIMTRPMEIEDLSEEEYETDIVVCDWCEEEYAPIEMHVCICK